MKPHYTHKRSLVSMLFVVLCGPFSASLRATEPASSPPEMLADAQLTDVVFVDADRGWAVGDRGVILWTTDGGRRWQLADSPVNCRLEAVFFLNADLGWAVGGWLHPYTHKSTGVVLQTTNGGRRWTRSSMDSLPKLKQVTFTDERNGWAVCSPSPLYPAGLVQSRDGGRTWNSIAPNRWGRWSALAAHRNREPWVAGASGISALHSSGQLMSQFPMSDARQPRALQLDRAAGWIAGDGGLLLTSSDSGETWKQPYAIPSSITASCDFSDLAAVGRSVWISGTPGSVVLHSQDGGGSWEPLPTRQPVPLNGIHFTDEQHGWAVGDLGTILATRDGGRTWIRQRGFERLAVLGLFSSAPSIPLEALARLSGDEGYLAGVKVVVGPEATGRDFVESTAEERTHEAVVSSGASFAKTAVRLTTPLTSLAPTAEKIVQQWDGQLDEDSLALLERQIVQAIRVWRPEIVLTEHPGTVEESPVDYLVNQVVLAAIRKADDETAFPEQMHSLGLEPWRARKVFATTPDASPGTLSVQTSRLATRLGRTLRDQVSVARGLVRSEWAPSPSKLSFDLLLSEVPRDVATADFFRGIAASRLASVRRKPGAAAADYRSLMRTAQKERNVQQILLRAAGKSGQATPWLAQLEDLLTELPPNAAGEALFQLGRHYQAAGRLELRAEVLERLVHDYPTHALAEKAALWLLKLESSSEARWGLLRDVVDERPAVLVDKTGQLAGGRRQVVPAAAERPIATAAERIDRRMPGLRSEPNVRCMLASLKRRDKGDSAVLPLWEKLARDHALGSWSQCARGEIWLTKNVGLAPKPTAVCLPTRDRPELDGILDEEFWAQREILQLTSAAEDDDEWKATVQLARDNEFLYWAIACRKAHGVSYEPSSAARPRDANLSTQDRVELVIDVDRDYSTFYRLSVDHRGWTSEACFGELSWNPKWFVAANSDESTWTVEAAIPLSELTPASPARNEVWAIGLQRTVPGVGFQSWNHPSHPDVRPEGLGYLRF